MSDGGCGNIVVGLDRSGTESVPKMACYCLAEGMISAIMQMKTKFPVLVVAGVVSFALGVLTVCYYCCHCSAGVLDSSIILPLIIIITVVAAASL